METVKSEKVSWTHHTIYTDIEIGASPDVVWSVLTDTQNFRDWAAFLVKIDGEIKDGETITAYFQTNPDKEKLTVIDHTIKVDDRSFYWAEKGPGGIRDNHHFIVEAVEGGKTRFIQSDEIRGGITWLMGGQLVKMYKRGYQAFNRGLKVEAERRANEQG